MKIFPAAVVADHVIPVRETKNLNDENRQATHKYGNF